MGWGGDGHDTYVFDSLADLNADQNLSDTVWDFDFSLDVIDLSGIDPITDRAGNDSFTQFESGTWDPGQRIAGTLYYSELGVLYGFVGAQGTTVSASFAITLGWRANWDGANIIL